jgi:hypothetical protein
MCVANAPLLGLLRDGKNARAVGRTENSHSRQDIGGPRCSVLFSENWNQTPVSKLQSATGGRLGWHAMLESLSREIRDCYQRAEACARMADAALHEAMRLDLLRLEQSWLNLARSYEFAARLVDFTGYTRRTPSPQRRADRGGNDRSENAETLGISGARRTVSQNGSHHAGRDLQKTA